MVSTTPIRSMFHSRGRDRLVGPVPSGPQSRGEPDRSEGFQNAAVRAGRAPDLGRARRRRGLARVHPDGGLRRQCAARHRAGRGPGADRRRWTALPRCDLLPLGQHPGPPRPRARCRPRRPGGPDRPLHDAGQRQHDRGGAGRGPRPRGAGRRPPLPLCRGWRGGGRTGAQDRVPVLGQPGHPGAHARSSRSAMRTTATPSARSHSATAVSSVRCSSRSVSRSCARRDMRTRVGRTRPAWRSRRTGRNWPPS